MDITPLVRQGAQVIQSYAGGRFRISGTLYEGAVIVFPDHTMSWSFSDSVADLKIEDFDLLSQSEGIDVVLLGTGKNFQFIVPDLRKTLKERGLSVDAMDTGAACRTYNVLLAEGRRVAAMLLPVL